MNGWFVPPIVIPVAFAIAFFGYLGLMYLL